MQYITNAITLVYTIKKNIFLSKKAINDAYYNFLLLRYRI